MQKKNDSADAQRVDQWLYCARFFKTRSAASAAINSGRVLANGLRVKPSKHIRVGSALTIRYSEKTHILTVLKLQWKRLAPKGAQLLYQERVETTINSVLDDYSTSSKGGRKPTKRERRQLDNFKQKINDLDRNAGLG